MTLVIDPKAALLKGVDPVQFCVFEKITEIQFLTVCAFLLQAVFFCLQPFSAEVTEAELTWEFHTDVIVKTGMDL
nr:hypothetical protein [Faecalibaculum rodentium]